MSRVDRGKMPHRAIHIEESSKTFLDPDPEEDNFQNLNNSDLPTDKNGKNFHEDPIRCVKLLTDKHDRKTEKTDKRTNAG